MFCKFLTSLLIVILLVPQAQACTAFVVYRNGMALAGNNEDFWVTDTKIWYVPSDGSKRGMAGKLGRVYFGFNNFYPQGGMNEAGLFFDGFATAENKIKNSKGKSRFEGNIVDHVMANCSTLDEVVEVFEKYDLSFLANAMLMFGDQHGDSVIIEGDEFLRIKGDHQVVTNFYQSLTSPEKCHCSRYKAAVKELAKRDPVSIESCRDILAKTRQNGRAPTQYSNVYDLKEGLIYLYHFHEFDEVVVIDLKKELAKGPHELDLPSLFSKKDRFVEFEARRKRDIQRQVNARIAKNIDPKSFHEFAGEYAFDIGGKQKAKVNFLVEDDGLFAYSDTDKEKQQLFPEAKDRFFFVHDHGLQTFEFSRGEDKQVTGVVVKILDLDRRFEGVKVK